MKTILESRRSVFAFMGGAVLGSTAIAQPRGAAADTAAGAQPPQDIAKALSRNGLFTGSLDTPYPTPTITLAPSASIFSAHLASHYVYKVCTQTVYFYLTQTILSQLLFDENNFFSLFLTSSMALSPTTLPSTSSSSHTRSPLPPISKCLLLSHFSIERVAPVESLDVLCIHSMMNLTRSY